ncbi:hypothetical protein [Desulfosarcina cetonica]|nr:hypothetical protein [Desulfosarcina cetonica]
MKNFIRMKVGGKPNLPMAHKSIHKALGHYLGIVDKETNKALLKEI